MKYIYIANIVISVFFLRFIIIIVIYFWISNTVVSNLNIIFVIMVRLEIRLMQILISSVVTKCVFGSFYKCFSCVLLNDAPFLTFMQYFQ